MVSLQAEFTHFHATRKMSPALYRELFRLGAVVFYGKGIRDPETRDDLFSDFLEKRLLRFPDSFYLRLSTSTDKQIRSYVAFAINKTVLDFFRRKGRQGTLDPAETDGPAPEAGAEPPEREVRWEREVALTEEEFGLQHLPAMLREEYKLIAWTVFLSIWQRLKSDQQQVFCLLYNAGKTTQEIAQLKTVALGTVQNNKQRIGEIAYQEADVREVAELAYQLMALHCCLDGQPCRN
ncbi:MAG: RNA polymerase sigma factor [Candidatus Sericytochromatia bacterium]